jgi:hypothetical protein
MPDRRTVTRAALLFTLAAFASGCGATYGTPGAKLAITENKLPAKGTTEAQILGWIGEPNERTRFENGREEWSYIYSEAELRHPGLIWIPFVGLAFTQIDTKVYTLSLSFDPQGNLVEVKTALTTGRIE